MGFAKTQSAQVTLLSAHIVDVEVDISRGLHAFSIVGLPDKAVEEARDRIGAAIKHSGFTSPKQKNQKVVIALAPAELKKEGSGFDVAMALSYLRATGDIRFDPKGRLFLGELSLQGELRSIRGVLPMARKAAEVGYKEIYVPIANANEAALIEGITVFGVKTLAELIRHLNEKTPGTEEGGGTSRQGLTPQEKTTLAHVPPREFTDLSDIRGQATAKRGLEIAAAGGHNIALYGPPGTGKTLLARALAHILPPLTFDEVLEVTSIHSVTSTQAGELLLYPPFRSPHHTASYVAIVGGGTNLRPGEVTLAHRGVLFLDEFPEFDRRVLESLREPLEEKVVSIARARGSAQFPAHFILVAAFNPCPCGNFGSATPCRCAPLEVERYRKKLSGPLLDRIDMWIEVAHLDFETMSGAKTGETSASVCKRVHVARGRQHERFGHTGVLNSSMHLKDIETHLPLTPELKKTLSLAVKTLKLSPRAYHRVLKLARTIADLGESDALLNEHLLEALRYRPKTLT
jgi:magnesium chelatase family protein